MSDMSRNSGNFPRPGAGTQRIGDEQLQHYIAQQLAKRANKTSQLEEVERQRIPFGTTLPYGLGSETTSRFVTLPANGETSPHHWILEMTGLPGRSKPIGIKVVGDIVFGVSRPGYEAPDLDLSPYQADEKGVSRRHALIRPSHNRLYLIDLKSTNGTRVNAVPVGSGVAMEIRDHDTISLGALTFNLRILASPADLEKQAALGAGQIT